MKKKFTLLNLFTLVAFLAGVFAWIAAFRFATLPDGYIWDEIHLRVQYPETPEAFESASRIQFSILGQQQTYSNGEELYRENYYQGWWICRRNFYVKSDGFPFDSADWEYIDESLPNLAENDFRMHPQLTMRDGCRDCSLQIQELLKIVSEDELRTKLISSKTGRFLLPVSCTVIFAVLLFWQFDTFSNRNKNPEGSG